MSGELRYHIPPVGLVRTSLHKEALQILRSLEGSGEVERQKRLDHLGLIRRVSEGAHHPRWEYIALIMHLTDLAAANVRAARLGSGTKLRGFSDKTSGKELFKAWALILNAGHLVWTFTAERALLSALKGSSTARNNFLGLLPDDDWREYGREILREESIYRMYHLISAVRSRQLCIESDQRRFWLAALKLYCMPGGSSREARRLVELYKRVRTAAFLLLDSYYTPSLVMLDFQEILTDPERLWRLLDPGDSSTAELMAAVESSLYEAVYLSEDVSGESARVIPDLRRQIQQALSVDVASAIEALAQGIPQSSFDPASSTRPELLLRIPYRSEEVFRDSTLVSSRPIRDGKAWRSCLPAAARPHVESIVWPFPDGHQCFTDFFLKAGADEEIAERSIASALRRVGECFERDRKNHERLMGKDFLQSVVYERIALGAIRATLKRVFPRVARWDFRPFGHDPEVWAIFSTRLPDLRHFISREIRAFRRKHASSEETARKAELFALRKALDGQRGNSYALALVNVQAFDVRGRSIAEIDGLWVASSYRRLRLNLVEAKQPQRSPSAKIRRQMKEALRRLEPAPDWQSEYRYVRKTKQTPHFGIMTLTRP